MFTDNTNDGKTDPVSLIVEWGKSTRSNPDLPFTPIRSNWVKVDDLRYPAIHNIYEPPVYAVFSADWYGKAVIKTRFIPFGTHQEYSTYDSLYPLFADTMINRVDARVSDANLTPYLTSYEPHLFDRAMTLYQGGLRGSDFRLLREGHRATEFYGNHITAQGVFDLRGASDIKYNYGESPSTDYWLTGDDRYLSIVQSMIAQWDTFNVNYTSPTQFWTERHAGFKLLGYVTAYELLGDPAVGQKAKDTFQSLVTMQNNPMSNAANTGCLMHTLYSASEGDETNVFVASPWMSTLMVDAIERYYIHSQDGRVKPFMYKLADCITSLNVSLYKTGGDYDTTKSWTVPYYLAGPGLTDAQHDKNPWGDSAHALDVAKIPALAYYFSRVDGTPNASYLAAFSDLYKTQNEMTFRSWIRPDVAGSSDSVYRLSPPRMFNWWFRTTTNLDWLVTNTRAETEDTGAGNMVVTISANKTRVIPGDIITYSIEYKNYGTTDAINTAIRSPVTTLNCCYNGGDVSIVPGSISNNGTDGYDILWNVGIVKPSDPPKTLTYQLKVNAYAAPPTDSRPHAPIIERAVAYHCRAGETTPTCSTAATVWDTGTYTQSSASNMVVTQRLSQAQAIITLLKTADKQTAISGDTITYTLTYTNDGASPATNITVSDPIPSGTTYIPNSATSSGQYNTTENKLTWNIPTLAVGANSTATFQVKVQ